MKIVFLIPRLAAGAGRALVAFADRLAQSGQEVHIVCSEEPKDYAVHHSITMHLLYPSGVSIRKIGGLCNILTMAAQMRRIGADVIISFQHPFFFRIYLSAIFSKTRILYAIRNNPEIGALKKRDMRRLKLAYCMADAVWIQTEDQRRFLPERAWGKTFVVHNVLDRRFLEIPRREKERICRFISAGRIAPQKNQKVMILAFAEMLERTGNEEATLTIYGRFQEHHPETAAQLRALIIRFHLEERITLPGRVSDMEAAYEQADAFVFSSDYEGCPNALMEAMAAGLPCISTDCPTGPSDLIDSGKNGLLIPVGDVEAMSLAMEYLIENPQQANRMGMEAKQRMREWEKPEDITGQLLGQLYNICT